MLRRSLMVVVVAVVACLGLAACSGNGPTDPNPPGMPMQVTADSLSR